MPRPHRETKVSAALDKMVANVQEARNELQKVRANNDWYESEITRLSTTVAQLQRENQELKAAAYMQGQAVEEKAGHRRIPRMAVTMRRVRDLCAANWPEIPCEDGLVSFGVHNGLSWPIEITPDLIARIKRYGDSPRSLRWFLGMFPEDVRNFLRKPVWARKGAPEGSGVNYSDYDPVELYLCLLAYPDRARLHLDQGYHVIDQNNKLVTTGA